MSVIEQNLEIFKFYFERIKPLFPDINTFFHDKFFHYTSITSFEQIIKNNSLRFTRSVFLNDRNEITHAIHILKHVYNDSNWKHLTPRSFKTILRYVKNGINNSFILSLSSNKDSLALWGIYSNFSGYNFTLNLDKLFKDHIWNEELYVKSNGEYQLWI